jgi:RNA polymerase sigma factor for flagellar operon FliA
MNSKPLESYKISNQERDETILKYAPLIKYIATRFAIRLPPHIDMNDVVNSGVLGLIDAIEKFDETKGVKFKTYAEFRIKGAILDNLRSLDWVSRSTRKTATLLENTYTALEKKLNRPATDEEVAEALNISLEKLYEFLAQASGVSLLSLDMISSRDDPRLKLVDCLIDSNGENPLSVLKMEEIRDMVARAIDSLPEKEKMVVALYYYDDLTMKEVSRVLKITESRVSQIHTKAIIRLRGKLRERLEEI